MGTMPWCPWYPQGRRSARSRELVRGEQAILPGRARALSRRLDSKNISPRDIAVAGRFLFSIFRYIDLASVSALRQKRFDSVLEERFDDFFHHRALGRTGEFFNDGAHKFAYARFVGNAEFFFFCFCHLCDLFARGAGGNIDFKNLEFGLFLFGQIGTTAFFKLFGGIFALLSQALDHGELFLLGEFFGGLFAFGDEFVGKSGQYAAQGVDAQLILRPHRVFQILFDGVFYHEMKYTKDPPWYNRLMEWLIIALLIANLAVLVFLALRNGKPKEDDRSLMMLQNQIQDLARGVDQRLGEGSRAMNESVHLQFEQSQKLISNIQRAMSEQLVEVVRGVTETKESTKQVFTIAEQLHNLEKVLTHQKQRGNLGEASLELILGNILPPTAFKMQYDFPGGETVDAAIMTKEGIIPVDAKFSLDNYNRLVNAIDDKQREELERHFKNDLKLRIDETAKYVRPKDGTLPFAFMYIPAEAIYYDLLVNEVGSVKVNTRNLIDYAYQEKKVIIVSPTTFAAYLQSVLYGFKAFKIEESAKEIGKHVETLGRHLKAYEEYYNKLGNSLSTTVNHFNAGRKELGKIDKDVLKITGTSPELDSSLIEKPASIE